jgi:hypothetical protein
MKWKPIDDSTPLNEAVLVRNHSKWTLARRIFLEWTTLKLGWPLFETSKKLTWVFAQKSRPLDFEPTEWCRVEHQ